VDWYGKKQHQDWRTPKDFFDRLNTRFLFDLDGACDDETKLLPEGNTLARPVSWDGRRVFCNPPWQNIRPFVEMAPKATVAVFLVPARPNVGWFHRALELGARVEFFKGRPKFVNPKNPGAGSSPVDCLLLIFEKGCVP
jgi:phage N-6-adenine-methyltransferase